MMSAEPEDAAEDDDLKALIQAGLDDVENGDVGEWDPAEMKRRMRERPRSETDASRQSPSLD